MTQREGARPRKSVAWVLGCIVLIAAPTQARATDEADVRCMVSYERGQQLKKVEGKLSAARVALRVCVETCPVVFRQDCERWLDETEALMPTVRFLVSDERGRLLTDVRVVLDEQLFADPLPKDAVRVDPGPHVFRFERAHAQPVKVAVDLQPGERDHRIDVTIASPPQPIAPANRDVLAGRQADAVPVGSRTPAYVFGTIGVTALALAGGFLVIGHLDRAELQDTCAPRCSPHDADGIRTLWWASAASAGAGALSLGLAGLLWPRGSGGNATAGTSKVYLRPFGSVSF